MTTLLGQRQGAFYDLWEVETESRREFVRRKRLENYVALARKCPFYLDRLSGYDATAESPLSKVPVLTSQDLRGLLPPQSRALVQEGVNSYNVFQSGGTTGTPKTTLFSHAELDALDLPNARGFYACGLRAEDRVANLFAVGSLYMTFVHINRMLQGYGCVNFPFANNTLTEFVHTVTKQFDINVFAGVSSIVLNTLREFEPFGKEGIRLEKIFYGGEHLYDSDKRELFENFGVKTVLAPGYGTVDTWYLGYQCTLTPTGVFHAHDDQAYIEIVDPETGDACAKGETGIMYATAFPREITPIVRYAVGDRAYWLKEPCPCGRTTPLFKLLGRGDDTLRIGYDAVDYNSIQTCVLEVPGLSGSVQIEKLRDSGKDRLVIRVEAPESTDRKASSEALARAVIQARPGLQALVTKELIWPLQVEVVSLGTLARNQRTGKLVRVLDKE